MSAFASQPTAEDVSKVSKMLNFAKNALVESTSQAKTEFGIEDDKPDDKPIDTEKKYQTVDYRDIFYPVNESSLITQAYDYFKQGKKMQVKPEAMQRMEKANAIITPIIRLSSVMYGDATHWTIFTSFGRFTYKKPFVGDVKVIGISSSEVEFIMPFKDSKNRSTKSISNDVEHRNRVFIEGDNIVARLRVGECIFEKDLQITTKCAPITIVVDKPVEN